MKSNLNLIASCETTFPKKYRTSLVRLASTLGFKIWLYAIDAISSVNLSLLIFLTFLTSLFLFCLIYLL